MYEYQGFHSGEKLKATQLVAIEDGIINAENLAREAMANTSSGGTKFYVHNITTDGPGLVLISTRKDRYLLNEEISNATQPMLGIKNGVIANQSDFNGDPAKIIEINSGVWQMQSWTHSELTFTITYFADIVTEL